MPILTSDQPLWLPKGSIRALLSMSVVLASFWGRVETEAAMLVLGFYFLQRTQKGP